MSTRGRQPLVIAAYNPSWPSLYEHERSALLHTLGAIVLGVEHIGSTAVVGLAAKAIIDILVGLPRLEDADGCMPASAGIGYQFVPEALQYVPDDRYFRRPIPDSADAIEEFHLHLTAHASTFWRERVRFRDLLRSHPEVATAYVELKRELAQRYTTSPEYSVAKTDFIRDTLSRAVDQPP
jgi:GrpB-like predicted nucleotidyltransferase (UPF0157 family)